MKRLFAAIVLLLAATPLLATNGYFVHGNSTSSKAMGGAGIALSQEALDVSGNPASAAFLDNELSAGVALFSPDRSYTVIGNPSGYPGTFGLQSGSVRSKSRMFFMPSLAANIRPADSKNAFSFAFFAHGGMNTDYRTNTFYGSDHTGVDLGQMFLTATYARRITERQSIGISAVGAYQRFSAQGLQAFQQFSSDPDCVSNRKHASSKGFGIKAGYLAQLLPNLSIGASYSPRISMSRFERYCGLFTNDGKFDIPANGTIGIAWSPVQRLTLAGDVERVKYSGVASVGNPLLPNLAIDPLGTQNGPGFGWRDMTTYKFGARYRVNDAWTFRAGYSTGKQPIPDTEVLFNILAPAVIQQHYTAGVSHGPLNVSFMYAPSHSVTGANPLEAPGQQSIKLSMHEFETELNYNWRF